MRKMAAMLMADDDDLVVVIFVKLAKSVTQFPSSLFPPGTTELSKPGVSCHHLEVAEVDVDSC